MTFLVRIRLVTFAVIFLGIVASAPAIAQKLGPDGAPNPTASVVDQQTLLKQIPRIEGRIDIPDEKAAVLIQPMGRTWDYFHEVLLHWGGAIVILGMIAVLAAAYLVVGRLRIAEGRSGTPMVFSVLVPHGCARQQALPVGTRVSGPASPAPRRSRAVKSSANEKLPLAV